MNSRFEFSEGRFEEPFHGVGPVPVNIFPRELRPFRGNVVRAVAEALNLALDRYDWKSPTFAWVEAGRMRLRRGLASATGPVRT